MRVGARKGCKEHLERSESASINIINIIYNIYNTYTLLFCTWWLRHPRGVSLTSFAAPSGLPQNNSKKKREGKGRFLPPLFIICAASHSLRTVSQSMMTGFSSMTVMVGASSIILLKVGPTIFSNVFFKSLASIKRAAAHPLHMVLHPLHT